MRNVWGRLPLTASSLAALTVLALLTPLAAGAAQGPQLGISYGHFAANTFSANAGCAHSFTSGSFDRATRTLHGFVAANATFSNVSACAWPYSNATAGFWGSVSTRNLTAAAGAHRFVVNESISYLVVLGSGSTPAQFASASIDTYVALHDLTSGAYVPWQFPGWSASWQSGNATRYYNGTSTPSLFLNYSLVSGHVYQVDVGWTVSGFVWSQGLRAAAMLSFSGPTHGIRLVSLSVS